MLSLVDSFKFGEFLKVNNKVTCHFSSWRFIACHYLSIYICHFNSLWDVLSIPAVVLDFVSFSSMSLQLLVSYNLSQYTLSHDLILRQVTILSQFRFFVISCYFLSYYFTLCHIFHFVSSYLLLHQILVTSYQKTYS